ncbi:MAG: hypothetical protein K2K48_07535 [Anaeroplasmataceae bacterium]|nr:hypothetical protein [Anaeroplasmataceae bacterium]MDE6415253.1 hypothetical protein [Anaeroplasmataceae bacterium]
MYKIQNEIFCLSVSEFGAEPEKIIIKDVNVLWNGNEPWQEKSPLLFPIIGNLKDGYFKYGKQNYFMKTHGFLKDQQFQVVNHKDNSITLKSTYTEQTLAQYPFLYEFYITYSLIDHQIKISIEVCNLGEKEMLFSVGLHPGFDYNGLRTLLGDNIEILFSPTQVNSILFNPNFVKKIENITLPNSLNLASLSLELLSKKTICYQGVNQIDLKSQTNSLRIKHSMPFISLWQSTPENPQFLCIEPWYGLPDKCRTNHRLEDKLHIQKLKSNESFKTEIIIEYIEGV